MVTENALLKLDIADIFTVEKNLNIITSYDVAIPKLKKKCYCTINGHLP